MRARESERTGESTVKEVGGEVSGQGGEGNEGVGPGSRVRKKEEDDDGNNGRGGWGGGGEKREGEGKSELGGEGRKGSGKRPRSTFFK